MGAIVASRYSQGRELSLVLRDDAQSSPCPPISPETRGARDMSVGSIHNKLPPILLAVAAAAIMARLHKAPTEGVDADTLFTQVIPKGLMTRSEFTDFMREGVQSGQIVLDGEGYYHDAHNWKTSATTNPQATSPGVVPGNTTL